MYLILDMRRYPRVKVKPTPSPRLDRSLFLATEQGIQHDYVQSDIFISFFQCVTKSYRNPWEISSHKTAGWILKESQTTHTSIPDAEFWRPLVASVADNRCRCRVDVKSSPDNLRRDRPRRCVPTAYWRHRVRARKHSWPRATR